MDTLDAVFGALSDPTRRSILERLTEGEATVSELGKPHDMSIQAVSKHLRKLEAAGLIQRRREGREVYCRIETAPMRRAATWIDEQRRFWEVRLERLEILLREKQAEASAKPSRSQPLARPDSINKERDHGHQRR